MADDIVTVSLKKVSEKPHSRTCLLCGSPGMIDDYQVGNLDLVIQACSRCLEKAVTKPPEEKPVKAKVGGAK